MTLAHILLALQLSVERGKPEILQTLTQIFDKRFGVAMEWLRWEHFVWKGDVFAREPWTSTENHLEGRDAWGNQICRHIDCELNFREKVIPGRVTFPARTNLEFTRKSAMLRFA